MELSVYLFFVLSILYSFAECTLLRRKSNMNQCKDDGGWDNDKLLKYVKEIKIDCASLCRTSEKEEQQFHRGNTYLPDLSKYC